MQQAPQAVIPQQFTVAVPIVPQQNVPATQTTNPLVPRPAVPKAPQQTQNQQTLVQTMIQPAVPKPQLPVIQPLSTQPVVNVPQIAQPKVPQIAQLRNPTVPQPKLLVAQPTVPQPKLPVAQPTVPQVIQPKFPVLQPSVPQVTQPKVPQVILPMQPTVPVQQISTPTIQQISTPTIQQMPTPTATKPLIAKQPGQPAQGGILRQFGGGTGVVTVATTPQTIAAPVINIVEDTGYSILMQLVNIWNGTEEQAKELAALQYLNGNYIIDPNRRDVIMEVIGMLRNQTYDEVLDFLTDAPNPEFVLWDQDSMDEGRIKLAREIQIQKAEDVGIKGVGKCRYCPSTELVFATKQTRSLDEPATIFVRCVMCHKQWRQ